MSAWGITMATTYCYIHQKDSYHALSWITDVEDHGVYISYDDMFVEYMDIFFQKNIKFPKLVLFPHKTFHKASYGICLSRVDGGVGKYIVFFSNYSHV